MRISLWIAAIALSLTAGPVAAAQQEDATQADKLPGFKEVDSNGDGQLTFQEVRELGIKKKTFDEEDLDNDGKLSKYDYKYGIK